MDDSCFLSQSLRSHLQVPQLCALWTWHDRSTFFFRCFFLVRFLENLLLVFGHVHMIMHMRVDCWFYYIWCHQFPFFQIDWSRFIFGCSLLSSCSLSAVQCLLSCWHLCTTHQCHCNLPRSPVSARLLAWQKVITSIVDIDMPAAPQKAVGNISSRRVPHSRTGSRGPHDGELGLHRPMQRQGQGLPPTKAGTDHHFPWARARCAPVQHQPNLAPEQKQTQPAREA